MKKVRLSRTTKSPKKSPAVSPAHPLLSLSKKARKYVIEMSYRSKSAELGSGLSISDILTVLYFSILHVNPKKPDDPKRDRFILSKGHGSAALYAVLGLKGYFPEADALKYRVDEGRFHGHPCRDAAPGIEVSTGSLGHGLSIAAGIALALQREKSKSRVWTLIGDGECNEGSIWEAAMFVATHKLTNVTAIIDDNSFQGFGKSSEVHPMNLPKIFESFGWEVRTVDGHDLGAIEKIFSQPVGAKPVVIIAKTIAGKGIPKIENTLLAHYYIPDEETYKDAISKL